MNHADKIFRANNLLQFIPQVTIEFRLRKSLAQERFKSNLESRYQILVSSIQLRRGSAKFMIPIKQEPNTELSQTMVVTLKNKSATT